MSKGIPPHELQPKIVIPVLRPMVRQWVRFMLLFVAGGLILVFITAIRLTPYDANGQPLKMETHRQLGIPPCAFLERFGKPCPACGLTTSFSLLMHGDLLGSLRANFVGTLLAIFCLGAIPWCVYVSWRGRYLWIRALEPVLVALVGVLTILLLLRWGIVLLLHR